jgi:hypothetical protein
MAVGRDLMTGEPLKTGPLRVWMLNGEEVQDEIDRWNHPGFCGPTAGAR